MKLNPNYRDFIVIGVNAYKLELEIDPEINLEINRRESKNIQWYRHKGNIKLKHLFTCKYRPFDTFDSNYINEMKQDISSKRASGEIVMKKIGTNSSFGLSLT